VCKKGNLTGREQGGPAARFLEIRRNETKKAFCVNQAVLTSHVLLCYVSPFGKKIHLHIIHDHRRTVRGLCPLEWLAGVIGGAVLRKPPSRPKFLEMG